MPACRYVEEICSVVMLGPRRSAGVTPEVNLRQCVTHTPPPITNKAAHSGFETHRCYQSKTGVSVAPQKGLFLKKLHISLYIPPNKHRTLSKRFGRYFQLIMSVFSEYKRSEKK